MVTSTHRHFLSFYVFVLILLDSAAVSAQVDLNVNFSSNQKERLKQIKELKKANNLKLKAINFNRKKLLNSFDKVHSELSDVPGLEQLNTELFRVSKMNSKFLLTKNTIENLTTDSLTNFYGDGLQEFSKYHGVNKATGEMKTIQLQYYQYSEQLKTYKKKYLQLNKSRDSLLHTGRLLAKRETDKLEAYVKQQALKQQSLKNLSVGEDLTKTLMLGIDQVSEINQKIQEGVTTEEIKLSAANQAKQLGVDHFTDAQAKLESAQGSIKKLKKKYAYVPNTDDMFSARKLSSLEGEPLKKRLMIGGTLQIHPSDPLGIDFNPLLGYMFNKRHSVGLGGTYRVKLGKKAVSANNENSALGVRVFTEYVVIKSFYAHLEYECIQTNFKKSTLDRAQKTWVDAVLIGAGRSYSLAKKVKGNITLLYNFFYDPEASPHEHPWMVRFGFQLTGK